MFLYLVRHGEALPENVDPEQHLSEKGMEDVSEMAAFMQCAEIKVDEIWHSSKERARRTAVIISEAVLHKNILEREGLKPNDPVENIAEEIKDIHENVMMVGHLPFLGRLASYLLSGSSDLETIKFESAAVACLEKWEENWRLSWLMDPELLLKCTREKGDPYV
jgi:phosphohistidine phosphatase